MKTTRTQATLGDLIVAVFEEAERVGRDPAEVSRLAISTLERMARELRATHKRSAHARLEEELAW